MIGGDGGDGGVGGDSTLVEFGAPLT